MRFFWKYLTYLGNLTGDWAFWIFVILILTDDRSLNEKLLIVTAMIFLVPIFRMWYDRLKAMLNS
ncbi:hypothetical protein C4568_04625 [Candidatus Parcubacteria bacterium]|nr:MAG: hypothetical protein C4568_04625 [Candidatus Parcubacteria bacterium]